MLTLRNLDPERAFTGSARVTLTSERDQQDIEPLPLALEPGREETIALRDARVLNGDWMMMVYDQGGVARLVRGASFEPPKPPAPPKQAPTPAPAPANPPGFVTGMIDATGEWTLSDSSAAQPGAEGAADGGENASGGGGAEAGPEGDPNANAQDGPLPEVTVSPRQLSSNNESVTMEFDISASRAINYLTITIRAGDFQDTRQALMSTTQGKVPFLVPANYAKEGFSYELKDDKGNILASGAGDFRMMMNRN
jgi:hypothetical protein